MTLELNIQAALLDGYCVETLDNRLFFLVREGWRRGPYTSERDAWRLGGIPDYSGNKIEALQFARRMGYETDGYYASPEIVQAVIDGAQVIEDVPEFVQDDTRDLSAEIAKATRGVLQTFGVDGMTLDELRDQAKANGMTGYWRLNKQDLFDAITEWVSGDEE